MPELDALTLAEHAVRLGLVSEDQVHDAWIEIGKRGGESEPFLRIMERKGFLTPWQSNKLLKGELEGFFLGGYRILYKIASGTFGRVYRADDPRSGTIVAIKVLRRKWSEDKHNIELFEREGKMGMSMRHPNVVQILALSRDVVTKQYYIVMEFIEGGNLRDFLSIRKKLEPPEAMRILEDATSALGYAHSRGLSHRDMKLTNILISTQTGVCKLVDFGLAEVTHSAARDGALLIDRTVDYAGLEKVTNTPPGDVRSDIYFMGCVLYELLTGRPPLPHTRDPRQRMRKERYLGVQPITHEEVHGPPSLFRLVETMMTLNPAERFQTPSQLLDAIRDVRRDLEGKTAGAKNGAKAGPAGHSLFVVEKDEGLQDKMRDNFKKMGYRVFLASDPVRALDRYRQQPYDALVIDAGTTGEDGLMLFDSVLAESKRLGQFCAGILILSESQRDWVDRVRACQGVSILVRPVTSRQLESELTALMNLSREE